MGVDGRIAMRSGVPAGGISHFGFEIALKGNLEKT